jgi:hypothetical protein
MKWIKKNWTYLFGLILLAIALFSRKTVEAMTSTCESRNKNSCAADGYDSTGAKCYWCGRKNGCVNPDNHSVDEFYELCSAAKPDDYSPDNSTPVPGPPPGFDPKVDPRHIPCGPGTYSANGEQPCQLCSAGTYAPYDFNMTCTMCPKGYTSDPGATQCRINPTPDPTPTPTPTPGPSPRPGPVPCPYPCYNPDDDNGRRPDYNPILPCRK